MQWIVELSKIVKEPILLLALVTFGGLVAISSGLIYLLIQKDKRESQLIEGLTDCNNTLIELATLVKVLVYGKRG